METFVYWPYYIFVLVPGRTPPNCILQSPRATHHFLSRNWIIPALGWKGGRTKMRCRHHGTLLVTLVATLRPSQQPESVPSKGDAGSRDITSIQSPLPEPHPWWLPGYCFLQPFLCTQLWMSRLQDDPAQGNLAPVSWGKCCPRRFIFLFDVTEDNSAPRSQ